ncbi:MAG TPA: hypothetical protein VH969_21065 [Actinophytocola sp.]|jgi:hypothetical protein|uniref:hypothetical protein n=1 Tax=Actinophytocola sp. TaxID=1872138 RepID=UPI002F95DBD2
MKLDIAIRELHRAEQSMARDLLTVSERHHAEHEIHHVARDLAGWSRQHVQGLAEAGREFGLRLDGPAQHPDRFAPVRAKLSEMVGRRPEPGLQLLADLRRLHRKAAGVSVDWELLAQGAQATKNPGLLELAQHCHPQTLRQLKWTNAMLKTLSPQVLAS